MPGTSIQPALSRGTAIEYKAFARQFQPNFSAAAVNLIATCYYPSSGFAIFFEEDSGEFSHVWEIEWHCCAGDSAFHRAE
jgi:hypothetical protein